MTHLLRQAAAAFHEAAAGVLAARGEPATLRRVAEVLGADERFYANVRRGERGSFDTIVRWLHTWSAEAGMPPLRMTIEADSARVEVIEQTDE